MSISRKITDQCVERNAPAGVVFLNQWLKPPQIDSSGIHSIRVIIETESGVWRSAQYNFHTMMWNAKYETNVVIPEMPDDQVIRWMFVPVTEEDMTSINVVKEIPNTLNKGPFKE